MRNITANRLNSQFAHSQAQAKSDNLVEVAQINLLRRTVQDYDVLRSALLPFKQSLALRSGVLDLLYYFPLGQNTLCPYGLAIFLIYLHSFKSYI